MKSVDKFDHPDFVGGVVWSSCELEWIRNRDKEWESELAEVRRENAELKEALQHPSYEVENRLRAQRDELQSNVKRMAAAAVKAGLPSADELAGRHVHKGRTVPVITCCEDKSDHHGPDWTERDGEYLK